MQKMQKLIMNFTNCMVNKVRCCQTYCASLAYIVYDLQNEKNLLKGIAYSSGHLVPSNLVLACVLLLETNLLSELVVIFPDYAIRTSLGTFSSLLSINGPFVLHEIYSNS